MRAPARFLVIGLVVGLLSACADYTTTGVPQDSSTAADASDPLAGTSWSLSDATLGSTEDIASLGITAAFADDAMAGRAPVNTYSASYTVEGSALRVGPVASTKMAGTEAAMQAEQAYFDTLATVTSFAVEEGQLLLLAADKQVLAYARNTSGDVEKSHAASEDEDLKATTAFAATLIGRASCRERV